MRGPDPRAGPLGQTPSSSAPFPSATRVMPEPPAPTQPTPPTPPNCHLLLLLKSFPCSGTWVWKKTFRNRAEGALSGREGQCSESWSGRAQPCNGERAGARHSHECRTRGRCGRTWKSTHLIREPVMPLCSLLCWAFHSWQSPSRDLDSLTA